MKKINTYQNIVVFLLLILAITCMTAGYALYGQLVELTGIVALKPDGKLEVLNINLIDSSNVSSSEIPVITNSTIEFNITFSGTNNEYYAVYTLDIVNNSSYDYIYNDFQFTPVVNSSGGGTGILTLNVEGIENGDAIKSGETRSITMTLNLEVSDKDQSYDASGTTDINTTPQEKGTILASITIVDDDLTGTNNFGNVKLKVINIYSKDITFAVSSTNSNFVVVDQNGNSLGNLTINANSETEYDVYLKINDDSVFESTTATTVLILRSSAVGNITVSELTLNVTKTEEVDNIKPQIGEVSFTINNNVGQADVSFARLDSGGTSIVNYTILLYDATTDSLVATYNTDSAITEYSITSMEEGTYYVRVYGTDEAGNSGSEDVNSSTTINVYCRQSPTVTLKWVFQVDTTGLNNMTSNGASTANIGTTYTTKLTANTNYTLPSTITVVMGEKTLTTSDYTYTSSSGNLTIPNVNGDIKISGSAIYSGICLVKGTKISLAYGKTKNIENIKYDDLLEVWNYETGNTVYEYPIWIEKEGKTNKYQLTTFSDGTTLKTVGHHGIFNIDLNMFVSVDDKENFKIGTNIAKIDEEGKIYSVKVKNIEYIEEETYYYHVVSTRYYNIIANDFLTTDGTVILSNLYSFSENITWPETRNKIINNKNNLYKYQDLNVLPYYMFKGLRAEEGKYLNNYGLTKDLFIAYLLNNQLNEKMLLKPNQDKNENRMWMVTTSDDIITESNKSKYLVKEETIYTIPKPKNIDNFLYWYNTSDGKKYNIGDNIKIWHGTHLEAVYKN